MDFQTYAARELTAVADKLADTARKQLEATTAQITANYESTIDRLRHDQTNLVNDNERLHAENAALTWEKQEMLEAAKTAARGPLIESLARAFEQIASSKSVDDALIAAAQALAGDFGRVAVVTAGQPPKQIGVETPALDPKAPSTLVFPIIVGGRELATICAADATRPGDEGTRLGQVLSRHVALALERLTIELKAVGELRAYARMLLDEVEYVFNADSAANVPPSERRTRLSENLRCARQIYGQRVTLEGPAAGSVLDDVLSQMLDVKGDTAFGRELAEVATAPAPA